MKKRPSKGVIYVAAILLAGAGMGYGVGKAIEEKSNVRLAQIEDKSSATAQRVGERGELATYVLTPTGSVLALLTSAGIADAYGKIKKSAYKKREMHMEDEREL